MPLSHTLGTLQHASIWWEHLKKQRESERKSRIVTWTKMKKALKKKYLPDHYRQDAFLKFHPQLSAERDFCGGVHGRI
jgi:hypothetical protein